MTTLDPMDERLEARREPAAGQEDEIDLAQLWNVLRNGKWTIAAFVVLALLVGIAYLFVTPSDYRANALIQVQSEQPPAALQGLMEATAMATGMKMGTEAATQIQIIESRSVIGNVVNKRGLTVTTTPKYFPLIGKPLASRNDDAQPAQQNASPDTGSWLGSYAWGPAELIVSALSVPAELTGEPLMLRALGNGQYVLYGPEGNKLLRGQVGKPESGHTAFGTDISIFVQKLVTSAPPTDFIVTKHAWLPVVQGLRKRLSVAEQGDDTGIIKISLEGENPREITATINAIANTYLRQNVEAKTKQAQQSLDFLKKQLPQLKTKLQQAETRLTQYRKKYQAVGLNAEAQALLQQMVDLQAKRSSLVLKQAELTQTYTSKHPAVQAVRDQITSIDKQKENLEKEINKLPGSQKKMLELKRDVEVNTTLYTSLLNRAQELRIVKAGTTGNVRIIDHAVVPVRPVGPNKRLVLALALVLGAMIGCGLVFLRVALRRTISDPRDIEQLFGLPVYAVIPFSEEFARMVRRTRRRRQPMPMLARDYPDEVSTEALRSLRTSMYFAQMESGSNVILISGPAPEVGKTFVSTNLAYLLAEAGTKVVVIDADMRRGKLHHMLNHQREPGLSQVLTGQVSLADALRPLDNTDCHVLTSGKVPPNPSELLMRESFNKLLGRLKSEYDYVLIDAPPVLAVTDAAVIAGTMPGIITFLVARAGMHPRGEIEESIKRMSRSGTKVAGVVFNGLKAEHRDYSGNTAYYYRYEYKPHG